MNLTHNNRLIDGIYEIAKKNNLEVEKVALILAESFKKVFLKEFSNNQIQVEVDLKKGNINMWRYIKIVSDEFFYGEGDEDNETLMPLSEAEDLAKKHNLKIKLNDSIRQPINIHEFEKKSVRAILSIFNQLIIETVNKQVCEKWIKYKDTVIEGRVEKIDEINNKDIKGAIVFLTNDEGESTQAYITRYEMIQTYDRFNNKIYESLTPGNTYLFYIKDVHEFSSGWPVNLTRTSPEIVKHLMKKNIFEIADGTVEIKNIARIAGVKTKVLVYSHDKAVDPIGSCVGPRGKRLKSISEQILNEKIDVIEWDPDPIVTLVNSVIPGKVLGYTMMDERDIVLITNEENYLSIIGKKGINIKLVSKLTGWSIDVKTIATAREEKLNFEMIEDTSFGNKTRISDRIFQKHKVNYETFMQELSSVDDPVEEENKIRSNKPIFQNKNSETDNEDFELFDSENYLD